ncbi:MAG: polysaccharide pyruvyl transferase family protein [Brotaphodocola sp.]
MGCEIFVFLPYLKKLEKSKQSYDLLLGTPIHTNLGDHLITLTERKLLSDIHGTGSLVEISTEAYQLYKERIKNLVDKDSCIFINGGGWMGTLWPAEEQLMQDMIHTFKDNKVIIFPQTIYYDRTAELYEELIASAQKIIQETRKLYLFVRDRQSYDFAKNLLNIGNVYLVPDIALSYDSVVPQRKRGNKVVGYCLRNDRERLRDSKIENTIRDILIRRGYHEKTVDTMTKIRIPSFLRKRVVFKRLKEFSECSLIVTDRLHGMIFAYVTGTPCVIMNNRTNKVFGVYKEWLSDVRWIYPVDCSVKSKEIISFIEYVEKEKNLEKSKKLDFDKFREIIING